MLHVCGVFGGLRGSAVDLFLSALCVRVLKLNCFTRARRNSTFHPSLSFSASSLVSISSACWSDKCVCDLCGGEFSCHCHLCFSSSCSAAVVASSKELRVGGGGRGKKRFFFVETTRSHRFLPHLVWAECDATQCYKFQRYSRFSASVSVSVSSSPISDILTSCQTIWWARVEFNYVTYIVERRAIKAINPSNAPYRLHEPPTRLGSSCLAPTEKESPIEIWRCV